MKIIDPGVAAYLKSLDAPTRATLTELRSWVVKAAPHASETMLYKMPTYLLGEVWVAYKAQKNYFSLYLCETSVVAKHAKALAHLNVGKGCIRFKKLEDLPKKDILEMLKESAKIRGFKDLPAKKSAAC
jgi:uncharacterized protein YdhG (YjbR/CyaY superfamily)